MNTTLVCLALTTAAAAATEPISVYSPSSDFAAVIRGQTPGGQPYYGNQSQYEEPYSTTPGLGDPTYGGQYVQPAPSPGFNLLNPYESGPMTYDPFLGAPPAVVPNGRYSPYGGPAHVFGPRPYRYGWQGRIDAGYLPKEDIEGVSADLEIFELDVENRYTSPTAWGWIYSFAHQFSWRNYDEVGGALPFPTDVFRSAWDFELSTPANSPFSYVLGFTPALNTDFEDNSTSKAWTFDGRAIAFYRSSPQWTWVGGVVYWDRVNDRLLPYAGVIWIPNDHTELRLLFPEARISKFAGTPWGVAMWYYVRAEFHVEAYEFEDSGFKDQYEISDWRVLLGLRTENAVGVAAFIEGGWVFDRQLDFLNGPNFDIESGFLVRGGLRY
ncbi:MAG TPA: hypothetical protein VML55_05470 [Planctomycetaceae bacterium]|nr:hypothetical protein [Planctomycetaceae bacterium]